MSKRISFVAFDIRYLTASDDIRLDTLNMLIDFLVNNLIPAVKK